MLMSDKTSIRESAANHIMRARQNTMVSVRKFHLPKINFQAKTCEELIFWSEHEIFSPPVISCLPNNDLCKLFSNTDFWEEHNFPCHSQAVERHVKLVTDSSIAVTGFERRNGYILAKLTSQSQMPKFLSKKDWFQTLDP